MDEPPGRLSPAGRRPGRRRSVEGAVRQQRSLARLIHMYIAGYIVTGFIMAAAYSFARLRGRWGRYERTALAIPLTIAALAAPVQVLVGDWAGREVATTQPTKLAAIEGLGTTTRGAPEHLLGWY